MIQHYKKYVHLPFPLPKPEPIFYHIRLWEVGASIPLFLLPDYTRKGVLFTTLKISFRREPTHGNIYRCSVIINCARLNGFVVILVIKFLGAISNKIQTLKDLHQVNSLFNFKFQASFVRK